MSATWRPERRNRNIGTAASGHSAVNAMRIPESHSDRHGNDSSFCERWNVTDMVDVLIDTQPVKILYEEPRAGFTYGCSPADVLVILRAVGEYMPLLPDFIVFRQPTRKQGMLNPVWGRLRYLTEFDGEPGIAIVLEAQPLGGKLRLSKRMGPEDRAEFERLVVDGHRFSDKKRFFEAELNEQAVRNTILYRTLLHELGHLADYTQKVLDETTALDSDGARAFDLYQARPAAEREHCAHAFAYALATTLKANGVVPFEPKASPAPGAV